MNFLDHVKQQLAANEVANTSGALEQIQSTVNAVFQEHIAKPQTDTVSDQEHLDYMREVYGEFQRVNQYFAFLAVVPRVPLYLAHRMARTAVNEFVKNFK